MSHPPIPISELAEHTEVLKANDNLKLSQEYEVREPKVKVFLLSIDFCLIVFSLEQDTIVLFFLQGHNCVCCFSLLVHNAVIMNYQFLSATYFLRYIGSLNMAKQCICHFQLYKIPLGGLLQFLNSLKQLSSSSITLFDRD